MSREECLVAVTNTVSKHEKYVFVQLELVHSIMSALTNYYVDKLRSCLKGSSSSKISLLLLSNSVPLKKDSLVDSEISKTSATEGMVLPSF